MSPGKWAACGCALAAALAIGFGYAQNAQYYPALAFILSGILWCQAVLRAWRWPGSLLLVLFATGAAVGAHQGFPVWAMLVGMLAALSAWDLDHMLRRFAAVKPAGLAPGLERRHLLRLAAVDGLGLLLGGAVLLIHIYFSFQWALVLGLVAIIALSQVVVFLRRSSG